MKTKHPSLTPWQMFWHFFRVSSVTLGGGYSMLLVFEDFYVKQKKLFTPEEWEDAVIIAQSSPGAFAVNLSYLVGFHLYGLFGATLSILGMVLPAFFAMSIVGSFMLLFIETSMVRSFMVGVACGPVAYYTYTFIRLAQSAFRKLWITLSFLFFTALQLVFAVPVWIVIASAIALIIIQVFFVILGGNPPSTEGKDSIENDGEDA